MWHPPRSRRPLVQRRPSCGLDCSVNLRFIESQWVNANARHHFKIWISPILNRRTGKLANKNWRTSGFSALLDIRRSTEKVLSCSMWIRCRMDLFWRFLLIPCLGFSHTHTLIDVDYAEVAEIDVKLEEASKTLSPPMVHETA